MEKYQNRVIRERDDLQTKYAALRKFIDDEGSKIAPAEENSRLLRQADYMSGYLATLNDRIASWNLPDDEPLLTAGEYRVGISFNPGGHEQVNQIKRRAAELVDYIQASQVDGRCAAIACTEIESAAMWAVKSVTKPDRPEHLK